MEVHAHSHTPRKKWTHYFWEFLMLFLAVFCGFLAEYQLEHKIEKDREKQFIASLIEDLAEDTLTLAETSSGLLKNVDRMDSLISLLSGDEVKGHESEIYYLGRGASRGNWLALHDRTIQQMKNSGGFRLIRNKKATKAILEYYNRYNFIEILQSVDLSESQEYRKIAVNVFHPVVFDSLVLPDNSIVKPEGNPPLLTYDKKTLFQMAGFISYSKNSRLALARAENQMKQSAEELIGLLKKEYKLN